MYKKKAFLWAFALTGLMIVAYYEFFHDDVGVREHVQIGRVLDGDTIELIDGRRIRLLNINTPEKNTPFSELAASYLAQYVNQTIELEVTGVEKYGRLLGRLYNPSYVNLALVRQGFATSFLVAESEKAPFKGAQEEAFEKNRGLWQKSPFYGCMNAIINKKDEYVTITHGCDSLNGWKLKDESTKEYIFKGHEPSFFVLYSAKGTDNNTAFFWNQGNVWNNDKDSIFVRDSDGLLVFYQQYGY